MSGININLLPTIDQVKLKENRRFQLVQIVSSSLLLLLIFLITVVFSLRVFQLQTIKQVSTTASTIEENVLEFKDKEATLVVLKNRLSTIGSILNLPSSQGNLYNLIAKSTPADVTITSISVDRSGSVLVSLLTANGRSIDSLLSSILKDKTADTLADIKVESLTRGKDGVLRATLKLASKK